MSIEEKIIDAVREEPIIYDKTRQFYKNKLLKAKAWKRISIKVGLDESKCHKKWKSLRDQYVRERSARSAPAVQKKEWKFFNKLTFLEGHVAGKKSPSKVENPEDSSQEVWNINSSSTRKRPSRMQIIKNYSGVLVPDVINIKNSQSLAHSTLYSTSDSSLPSTSNQMKRKKSASEFENISALSMFCKDLLNTVKFESNEIDLYFQNLARIVAAEKLSNLEFLDLQMKLASFLREQLQNIKK